MKTQKKPLKRRTMAKDGEGPAGGLSWTRLAAYLGPG